MKTEFVIYKGEIKFLDNQIKIRDDIYKWQKKWVQLDYRDEDRFEKFHLNELIETLKSYSIGTEVK